VDYSLEYQFNSYLYQRVAKMFLDMIAHKTLTAFEKRTLELKQQYENMSSPEKPEELPTFKPHPEKKKDPGILATMFKPRKIIQANEQNIQLEEAILQRLTVLRNKGKLSPATFTFLTDKLENDAVIRDQIKYLYSLEKDRLLNETLFVNYLKEIEFEAS